MVSMGLYPQMLLQWVKQTSAYTAQAAIRVALFGDTGQEPLLRRHFMAAAAFETQVEPSSLLLVNHICSRMREWT